MYQAFFILCYIFLLCTCDVVAQTKKENKNNVATVAPMSCRIKGKVVKIFSAIKNKNDNSICTKYPCRAKVKIMEVYGCGASTPAVLNTGDTTEMNFAFTLVNTIKSFPRMKAHYPGLKKGNIFYANVEQRMQIGSGVAFIIYDYQLK